MSIFVRNEKDLVSKAMSVLGKRMTPKRMKYLRDVQAPLMRRALKARKLNRTAVIDIRRNAIDYPAAVKLALKYKVNVSTVLKTKAFVYHKDVK